jgi:hypothetical protein
VGDDAAVEIHAYAFAYGIERPIGTAHADIGCNYQVLKGIGLVGEASAITVGAV